MICGVVNKKKDDTPQVEVIYKMIAKDNPGGTIFVTQSPPVAFGSLELEHETKIEHEPPEDERGAIQAVWQGEIYNRFELRKALDLQYVSPQVISDRQLLIELYKCYGSSCVEKINGPILAHPGVQSELNLDALRRYLVFNYNPAWDTFFRGIRKVRPGTLVILNHDGISEKVYWHLSFHTNHQKSIEEYGHELRELMRDSIRRRIPESGPLGIFLSGGMDSSSVAGLARDLTPGQIRTFSYRCTGGSYDESVYARLMADFCGAEHHEINYEPADIRNITSIVQLMDEPFCNVGILVATFLLGQAAHGAVSGVFSGDGGDELFGGHPVYTADKVAALVERIPPAVRFPVVTLLKRLPDSDEKMNLTVKLKRFSQSLSHPKDLGTQRWRAYYRPDELNKLLTFEHTDAKHLRESIFSDLIRIYEEADGPDLLSRSLYADFFTELGFSLRRMNLLSHFGITPHFPLLDHRIVEYAAKVPSSLKLRGLSDAKYIQRCTMAGILPDEIVYRRDKLGHSIPFKNWLRDDPQVKQFVGEVIFGRQFMRRGIFSSDYVQTLWDDHQNRRQNNSHRLWALLVLELWLSTSEP
jgi:asparagine synthase (glutamine-hydrolysing)